MTMTTEKPKTGIEGIEPEGKQAFYLNLLQGLSKQVSERNGKPGDILNTLTGEVNKTVEVIPVGYSWKVVLYKLDDDGELIEGDRGPEYEATVTDTADPRLDGRLFYNDKETGRKKNAVKMHVWKVVIPGTEDVLELAFKGTSLRRHDDFLNIIKASADHMSKVVIKLSSKKAEKGAYQVFTVEKARVATEEEAQKAYDIWNLGQQGDAPF